MEEQSVEQTPEDKIADFMFGEDPKEAADEAASDVSEDEDFDYEPDPKPVEEGAEAEDEGAEEGAEFVEVEYDGKLYEVPTELKDALLRQDDYTKKTQDVAEQRRQAEIQIAEIENRARQFQFAESIREDVMRAEQLEATATQYHEYLRNNIDTLSSTDIEKLRLAIEDSRRQRDEIVQAVQGKQSEFQQAQEQSLSELLNKGTEVLRSKIPGWNESHQKQVRDYALSVGFADAEINTVVDPRQVEVLWKASQYDALQQGKTSAVKKVQSAPTIKPKARNPMPKDVGNKLNLRKKLKSNKPAKSKAEDIGQYISGRFGM